MLKKILFTLIGLVLAVGLIGYFYFESGIRRGIEIAASSALGTQVNVSGVSLSPFSGKGSIRGLTIANPEGFESRYAVELGSLDVEVNMDSILSDAIEISSIVVKEAHVTYETRLVNDNIRTLIANIPTNGETSVTPDQPSAGTKIIIRDFQMIDPEITLQAMSTSAPIIVPDLHLQNIGDQSNAVTVAQAARQILMALNTSVLSANVRNLDALRDGVEQQLKDEVDQKIEELTNEIRGLLNR